jgi:hypothetical protein
VFRSRIVVSGLRGGAHRSVERSRGGHKDAAKSGVYRYGTGATERIPLQTMWHYIALPPDMQASGSDQTDPDRSEWAIPLL